MVYHSTIALTEQKSRKETHMKTAFRQFLDNPYPKLKFVLITLVLLGVAYLIDLVATSIYWSLDEDAVRIGDSLSTYGLRSRLIALAQLGYTVGVAFLIAWIMATVKNDKKRLASQAQAAAILIVMTLAHRCYVGIERVSFDFLHGVNNGALNGDWLMPYDRFDAIGDIIYALLVFYLARKLSRRYFGSGPVSATSVETSAARAAGVTTTQGSVDAKLAATTV